ncbi:MAG: hypothetical protein GF398_07155 [Chitinivibrionales bacterium]|nr:hypothetical protein [Chitinivibrionales bacterium]
MRKRFLLTNVILLLCLINCSKADRKIKDAILEEKARINTDSPVGLSIKAIHLLNPAEQNASIEIIVDKNKYEIDLSPLFIKTKICCGAFSLDTNWIYRCGLGKLNYEMNEEPEKWEFYIGLKSGTEAANIIIQDELLDTILVIQTQIPQINCKCSDIEKIESWRIEENMLHISSNASQNAFRLQEVIAEGNWRISEGFHYKCSPIIEWWCKLDTIKEMYCGCPQEYGNNALIDNPDCWDVERKIYFAGEYYESEKKIILTPVSSNFAYKEFRNLGAIAYNKPTEVQAED